MILLSALLASLSGLVAGERQPVRAAAQVQASALVSAAETQAAAVVAEREQGAMARPALTMQRRAPAPAYVVAVPHPRTRLALEQSWLE